MLVIFVSAIVITANHMTVTGLMCAGLGILLSVQSYRNELYKKTVSEEIDRKILTAANTIVESMRKVGNDVIHLHQELAKTNKKVIGLEASAAREKARNLRNTVSRAPASKSVNTPSIRVGKHTGKSSEKETTDRDDAVSGNKNPS